jgi:hypothetical protein
MMLSPLRRRDIAGTEQRKGDHHDETNFKPLRTFTPDAHFNGVRRGPGRHHRGCRR